MAGLGAARTLADEGYDVLILEARDRLGGRVWTSRQWPDLPVDLGASWIHGITDNPITALADAIQAPRVATSYDSSILYKANGQPLDTGGETQLDDLWKQIKKTLKQAQEAETDQSIQAAIDANFKPHKLDNKTRVFLDFLLNSAIEQEYGGDTSELSAYWYDNDEAFEGEDVLFPQGYGAIAESLAQGLPLELQQRVTAIRYGEQGVEVTTDRGVFQADRAIVTVPLGVLQQGSISFDPPLPSPKQQALQSLGMGVLNKCYLRFDQPFWPPEPDWIEYLAPTKGQWVEWLSLYPSTQKPLLLGFNAAQFGRELEARSDREIVAQALATLRQIYGSAVPDPLGYQITRWAQDPLAGGSYSFNGLGTQENTREQLAAPLGDRLFFAGEATSSEYFATVHGAYLSGLRAAAEVMDTLS